MRIAIVDDESGVSDFLKDYLGILGYEATVFNSGLKFLDSLDKEPFSLLTLDVMMPEIDGFGVFQELKSRGINMKILFISGYEPSHDICSLVEPGKIDFCPKPLDPNILKTKIEALIGEPDVSTS